MTYNQKLRKVMSELSPESNGDSEFEDANAEWAVRILKAIGITPENPNGNIKEIQKPHRTCRPYSPHKW